MQKRNLRKNTEMTLLMYTVFKVAKKLGLTMAEIRQLRKILEKAL